MSYPLRLPAELDAEARERCKRLGISLNALISVALDAYLRGAPGGVHRGGSAKRARLAGKAQQPAPVQPTAAPGAFDWRAFNDPDMWPYVDPEFEHRWEGVDDLDDAACEALEREYWSTRQRPE